MQFHNLVRKTKNKKNPARGRGGKRGKTSGRGTKGQKARSGRKLRPEIRDTIKRLPKLRGRGKQGLKTIQEINTPVSLTLLENNFSSGEEVSIKTLIEKKIVKKKGSRYPRVKILNNGEITKKLSVVKIAISSGAKEKIEKAGGKIS